MNKPLSLVDHAARVIEYQINEGHYPSGVLPGEMTLMKMLDVSRKTVRGALASLTEKGVLLKGTQGCRRRLASLERSDPALVLDVTMHGELAQLGDKAKDFEMELKALQARYNVKLQLKQDSEGVAA